MSRSKELRQILKTAPRLTVTQIMSIQGAAKELEEAEEANKAWGSEGVKLADFLIARGVKIPIDKCIMEVAADYIKKLEEKQ